MFSQGTFYDQFYNRKQHKAFEIARRQSVRNEPRFLRYEADKKVNSKKEELRQATAEHETEVLNFMRILSEAEQR